VIASILRPIRPVDGVDDQWRDSDAPDDLDVRRRLRINIVMTKTYEH